MSASQKSATKPYTNAIMLLERLGVEYTSGTWNSARVRLGKSSAKESTTQVRFGIFVDLNERRRVSANFVILMKPAEKVSLLPPSLCFFDETSWFTTSPWMKDRLCDSL